MSEEELNKLFKDNPIKTIKFEDIEAPVEYLKQTAVTINGDDYIKLQQENKQLKEENKKLNNIFDEIEDYMDDIDYKMGWQYANKLRELRGSDKE